ncbi:MAG: glycosyltransferase family 4 protein [Deltaproteobacteria bacterium]|nr:glycosyltransferase family 4 protein [Deltaproteobacteria bacterium]
MRIVLTCNFSPWSAYSGGGQRSTHNLARALTRRGHRVKVVFTKAPWERVSTPPDLPYELGWASLPDFRSRRQAPLRPLTALSVARTVWHELNRGGTDVVHSQGEEAAVLPLVRRYREFGLVVTPRYPSLPDPLLRPQGPTRLELARLGLLDAKYLTLGAALRGADYCSPPSFYAGDLMRRAYGLRVEQVRPVHNGVPEEFLDYRWRPTDGDRPLLFFGRLSESKGVDTILEALTLLGPRAPRTLIVGRGPRREQIASQIASGGLGGRVELHDWADHHTLGRLLEEASIALIPSREENFSLAVLSCLAVGTPLVTTPVGGTPEVIEDRVTGLLVEPGDAAGLARAIDELRKDRDFAAAIGRQGRRLVRSRFTWDASAARFEALYETLAA